MKRYFYRLPAEIMEEHGPVVACVYSVLLDACQESVFRANLKNETIAMKCGITNRTAITAINKLVEIGLVKRVKEGRRTVYDVVPVLPPKERNKGYIPETYRVYGDTYRELLRNIPDPTIREHYRRQMELIGLPLDEKAMFDLRTVAFYAENWKEMKSENVSDNPMERELIEKTGCIKKFTEYDEDEQAEFDGQLFFDDDDAV